MCPSRECREGLWVREKHMERPPYIPPEIVPWLRSIYPDRMPSAPLNKQEYDVMVGQQQVIRRIEREIKEQQGNLLNV